MIRQKIGLGKGRYKDKITWRSHEVSRIEAFSDAVFAFAITLLIVSLEVPKSFDELMHNLKGFIPFAICFSFVFQIWTSQNTFFRRFGLHDSVTMVLNAMLLFMVLFFMYPLKFLFTAWMLGGATFSDRQQLVHLFYIYSGGFASIYLLFALMYMNAARFKDTIALNDSEHFETKTYIYRNLGMVAVALLSIGFASLGFKYTPFAGMIYILIGPVIVLTHSVRGKQHRKLFGEGKG